MVALLTSRNSLLSFASVDVGFNLILVPTILIFVLLEWPAPPDVTLRMCSFAAWLLLVALIVTPLEVYGLFMIDTRVF